MLHANQPLTKWMICLQINVWQSQMPLEKFWTHTVNKYNLKKN